MITEEQINQLKPGDLVELVDERYPDVKLTGPITEEPDGDLMLGLWVKICDAEGNWWHSSRHRTIRVLKKAPDPLYVNHPRLTPVRKDIARDRDGDAWKYTGDGWVMTGSSRTVPNLYDVDAGPFRLLWDGETGKAVG